MSSRISKKAKSQRSEKVATLATENVGGTRKGTNPTNIDESEKSKAKLKERRKSKKVSIKFSEDNLVDDPVNNDDKRWKRKESKKSKKKGRRRTKSVSSSGRTDSDNSNEDEEAMKLSKAKMKRRNTKSLNLNMLRKSRSSQRRGTEAEREYQKMIMEKERRMKIKQICEAVGEEWISFALSLCIERFYNTMGSKIICFELRDTWHRVVECQWMDTWMRSASDLDAAMKKIELDNADTCLPLNYDTWSRGVLETLPNSRRQSVIDPFLRNDQIFTFDEEKSTLKFTQFVVEESQSYVSSELTKSSSNESLSMTDTDDERLTSERGFTSDENGSKLIFGPVKESLMSLSPSTINIPDVTTLMERNPSYESLSSSYSEGSVVNFDFSKWTKSQCDYFKGSGIFRYHNENSEEALARLKRDFCRADSSTAEHQMLSNEDNIDGLLKELAMDKEMHEFLKDYYDIQKTHDSLKNNNSDMNVIIHELLNAKTSIQHEGRILLDENKDSLDPHILPSMQNLPTEISFVPNKKAVRFNESIQLEVIKPPKDVHSKTQMKKLWALTSDNMRKVFADQSDVNIEIFEIGGESLEDKSENESFTAVDAKGENTLSPLI